MNPPVRLGVSPTASTPPGFFSQRFWGFMSLCWNSGLRGLSRSPVVPPGLSAHKCGASWATCSTSYYLTYLTCESSPPRCPSLPLLPVWMNVSSLTPWLSNFHKVWFPGSSGCFLFVNLLLSFFWLCEEAQCVYLCLHLGQKSIPHEGSIPPSHGSDWSPPNVLSYLDCDSDYVTAHLSSHHRIHLNWVSYIGYKLHWVQIIPQ